MKKSKIGEKGYHLIEEEGCVVLMYKDWYVLRFNNRMVELAKSIQNEREFKLDDEGSVLISERTF
jgi:hypothetical protein